MALPSRGDVWLIDLDPTRGHEQAGRRPALVVSVDALNHGPADLVIVIPITSRDRGIPSHVPIEPAGTGGLRVRSFILCEAVRSVARQRLVKRLGAVPPAVLSEVDDVLRMLLRI